MEDNTFGIILFGIYAAISVLGMVSIIVSIFVADPSPTLVKIDHRYTHCTKPQQTSSGHKKETTMQKPKETESGTSLYAGQNSGRTVPKLKQGQYDPTATFIAKAEAFLEEDDLLEIDEDLLD